MGYPGVGILRPPEGSLGPKLILPPGLRRWGRWGRWGRAIKHYREHDRENGDKPR